MTMYSVMVLILICSCLGSNVLVVLDNYNLKTTHSKFLQLLQNISYGGNIVQIAYSFGSEVIKLKNQDRFKYQHVIIMCTAQKQLQSKIKVNQIISYFDQGGNIIIVADVDTHLSFRKLFYAFGVDLEQHGTQLKDHFNNYENVSSIIKTQNYPEHEIFFPLGIERKPLLYRGIGMKLVNYENYQLYNLIQAEPTTFSKNYAKQIITNAGSSITLVAAAQGLNNARALILGSLQFLSDDFLNKKQYGNYETIKQLIKWTFKDIGVIKVNRMNYHDADSNEKQILFNVSEKIFFQAEVEQRNQLMEWIPYVATDLQVQLVMLDAWVRAPLVQLNSATYKADFYTPQKEGVYKFKIIYKKAGYNFLKEDERVTIRPLKHDEFERFVYVGFPYIFGLFTTIFCTFIFVILYFYSGSVVDKKKQE